MENTQLEGLYRYISGYVFEYDLTDGAYWQLHVEAVESYNENFGCDYDWYDIQSGYIEWRNAENDEANHD